MAQRKQDANLKPIKKGGLTHEEAQARGAAGGKKSAEVRKARKEAAALCYDMLQSELQGRKKSSVAKKYKSVEEEDLTIQAGMIAGQIDSATKGNTKAFRAVLELAEQHAAKQKQAEHYELPARVIGKAFIDINRQIVPNKKYVFAGGRGSLKSSYISFKVIELLKNNPMMHACVVRKVGATLKDSVFAQLMWAINELGLDDEFESKVSPLEITYKRTGQKIYFRGLDDKNKLKGIKPQFGHIGIIWKEEKDQLSGAAEERSIDQSLLRGGAESYDFSSYNPPKSRNAWVNRVLLEPDPNRIVHYSNYKDAPAEWLGQRFLDDAEHLKQINPVAYENEYEGNPTGDGGNVFDFVEIRTITDEEIASFDRIHQGVDWGWYPDAYAFLRTHYDSAREKIYFIDENYVHKTPNSDTGQWIIDHGYDDFKIICDSAENKSIADYRSIGLPAVGAVKGPGSVEYGFKWLQSRTLVIDPVRTPHAYNEIINYEYERNKDDEIISGYPDHNDHAISALRYEYEPIFSKRGASA